MNKIALFWCEAQKECQKGISHLGGCLVTGEETGGVERRQRRTVKREWQLGDERYGVDEKGG